MIFIGYTEGQKVEAIDTYCAAHGVRKVFVLSPEAFPLAYDNRPFAVEHVGYKDIIRYVYFYRLLQEIDSDVLVVINECLRTQNRYDLTYNCIRNYLNQTTHQLIFQQLPQIDGRDDFMILFDFDTRSRWKRNAWDIGLIKGEAQVRVATPTLSMRKVDVIAAAATKQRYTVERGRLFDNLGNKDPHTIPRNLHLIGGKDKLAHGEFGLYVARNMRLKRGDVVTYDNAVPTEGVYAVIDWPHRFIGFSDFIKRTGQVDTPALVTDLKVDLWYWDRMAKWAEGVNETCASLR